jgi:hypothetical protein
VSEQVGPALIGSSIPALALPNSPESVNQTTSSVDFIETTVQTDTPKGRITTSMANPKSIFSRKRDLAYLVFFLIHIPVLLCKDTQMPAPGLQQPQKLAYI